MSEPDSKPVSANQSLEEIDKEEQKETPQSKADDESAEVGHYILHGYRYEVRREKESSRSKKYYVCKYEGCNKKFGKTWNFLDHARMHEGYKPYSCEDCGKSFTQKGNLFKHQRQHRNPTVRGRKVNSCKF